MFLHMSQREVSISYVAIGSKINSSIHDPSSSLDYPEIQNVVSAGYMVYPLVTSDAQPRIFVYFNNPLSGCFNIDCGFIQVDSHFALGAVDPLTSDTGNGLDVQIQKDDAQGLWWVSINRQLIGYYSMKLFQGFDQGNVAQWGGLILNTFPNEAHTTTAMGSGELPSNTQRPADLIGQVTVITEKGVEKVVNPDGVNEPFPGCYGYKQRAQDAGDGLYFSYGGTGFPHCDV